MFYILGFGFTYSQNEILKTSRTRKLIFFFTFDSKEIYIMKINSLLIIILSIISFGCNNTESKKINSPIESFQNSLVSNGLTGSNVFKVYKDGEIL